jgi:hypothetical protein
LSKVDYFIHIKTAIQNKYEIDCQLLVLKQNEKIAAGEVDAFVIIFSKVVVTDDFKLRLIKEFKNTFIDEDVFVHNPRWSEFLKETDGTHKFGIFHQNWKGDNQGYFAPIDSTSSWFRFDDYIFKYVFSYSWSY